MRSGTRIGLAVGFGYILGRRRKLRTALTLAIAVAAGRMSRDPGGLRKLGAVLPGSGHLADLGRLGAPLAGAGRAAAVAAADSGIDALSGKLRGQADALRGRGGGAAGPDDGTGTGPADSPREDGVGADPADEGGDDDTARNGRDAGTGRRR